MDPVLEGYITGLQIASVLWLPVAYLLTGYSWAFWRRQRRRWKRGLAERPMIILALALSKTLASIFCTIMVGAILIYTFGETGIPYWYLGLQATAVLGLMMTSFVTIAYIFVSDVTSVDDEGD